MHCFQIYFGKELYMFWTDLLSIIRSLNTVHTAIGICHASCIGCLLADSHRICAISDGNVGWEDRHLDMGQGKKA